LHDRAAGRIENTLPAAKAAIDRGFAIECDLQLTADQNAIVFHDDTLDRLTDATGRVDRKSLAEIRTARLKDSDAPIPTLDELLETVAGQVPLLVELKSHFNGDRRLEKAVARTLLAYEGPLAVMSFDPDAIRTMARLAPSLPRGLVADRFPAGEPEYAGLSDARRFVLRNLLEVVTVGAHFVAYDVKALASASAPLFLRHLGWPLLTWTVRTPADRAVAARYADQMIFEGFEPSGA
jgi:glycerophosphoryl diester phosphodiesterase